MSFTVSLNTGINLFKNTVPCILKKNPRLILPALAVLGSIVLVSYVQIFHKKKLQHIKDFFVSVKYHKLSEIPIHKNIIKDIPGLDIKKFTDPSGELSEFDLRCEIKDKRWSYSPDTIHIITSHCEGPRELLSTIVGIRDVQNLGLPGLNAYNNIYVLTTRIKENESPVLDQANEEGLLLEIIEGLDGKTKEKIGKKINEIALSMLNRSMFSLIIHSRVSLYHKISMIFSGLLGYEVAYKA